MADVNSSGSPLDTVASTVSERTIEAFKAVGNETRLAILLALWEAKDPSLSSSEPALSFSALHDRVDMRTSGNFQYHLDKLTNHFVEKTDGGYMLTTPAEQFLSAVFAGTLADQPTIEDEPVDGECYRCGAPVVFDYRDGILVVRCTSCEGGVQHGLVDYPPGTLHHVYRPPVGLTNRTPQEYYRHTNIWYRHQHFSMVEGACPTCSGSVTTTIHVCEDHDTHDGTLCDRCGSVYRIQSIFVCEVCKQSLQTPTWDSIFTDGAVKAFFHEHGLDYDACFDESSMGPIYDAIEAVTVRAKEPLELAVTVELDGDRLDVTLDDEAHVIDVTEVMS